MTGATKRRRRAGAVDGSLRGLPSFLILPSPQDLLLTYRIHDARHYRPSHDHSPHRIRIRHRSAIAPAHGASRRRPAQHPRRTRPALALRALAHLHRPARPRPSEPLGARGTLVVYRTIRARVDARNRTATRRTRQVVRRVAREAVLVPRDPRTEPAAASPHTFAHAYTPFEEFAYFQPGGDRRARAREGARRVEGVARGRVWRCDAQDGRAPRQHPRRGPARSAQGTLLACCSASIDASACGPVRLPLGLHNTARIDAQDARSGCRASRESSAPPPRQARGARVRVRRRQVREQVHIPVYVVRAHRRRVGFQPEQHVRVQSRGPRGQGAPSSLQRRTMACVARRGALLERSGVDINIDASHPHLRYGPANHPRTIPHSYYFTGRPNTHISPPRTPHSRKMPPPKDDLVSLPHVSVHCSRSHDRLSSRRNRVPPPTSRILPRHHHFTARSRNSPNRMSTLLSRSFISVRLSAVIAKLTLAHCTATLSCPLLSVSPPELLASRNVHRHSPPVTRPYASFQSNR
ncbi:hypothetical protein EXIGLDRAFT_830079 [Exidia glandulosa HHB12029]|uniref:Uncharacterized protein n=1 Tax=Exidia glandulosa HHB12029 TaxID=1314781 RepID=A0A165NWX4_EXIGL|nr:hypothetical protein EXIGLDRAFT_830079 [Exidia glandulosa HHB12029]